MLKKAIILDLDDTFFDSSELMKYIPKDLNSREEWDEFHKHLDKVNINTWALNLVNIYKNNNYEILFLTAREDINNCKLITFISIKKHYLKDFKLFMRNPNDYRSSEEVKKDIYIYNNFIKNNYDVELVIDDNESNCKVFKEFGLNVLKVFV